MSTIMGIGMKQTSIEWLYQEFFTKQLDGFSEREWDLIDKAFEQAKEMHKEEIIDSFGVGCQVESERLVGYHDMAKQYYDQTFK